MSSNEGKKLLRRVELEFFDQMKLLPFTFFLSHRNVFHFVANVCWFSGADTNLLN